MTKTYLRRLLLALFTFMLGVALVGAIYRHKTANSTDAAPPLGLATQAQSAPTEAMDSGPNPFNQKDSDPCDADSSTYSMMDCYSNELKKENAETVSLNHELVAAWAGKEDTRLRTAFKAAHKAWLEYRERNCGVIYEEWAGGTGQGPSHLFCLWSMTKGRNDELRTQLAQYR